MSVSVGLCVTTHCFVNGKQYYNIARAHTHIGPAEGKKTATTGQWQQQQYSTTEPLKFLCLFVISFYVMIVVIIIIIIFFFIIDLEFLNLCVFFLVSLLIFLLIVATH